LFWFCACWKRPNICFEGETCVFLCKNNVENVPEEMDGTICEKCQQASSPKLPSWLGYFCPKCPLPQSGRERLPKY